MRVLTNEEMEQVSGGCHYRRSRCASSWSWCSSYTKTECNSTPEPEPECNPEPECDPEPTCGSDDTGTTPVIN